MRVKFSVNVKVDLCVKCVGFWNPILSIVWVTTGFNVETVEYKNISFTVWDVGGQDKVQTLCFSAPK